MSREVELAELAERVAEHDFAYLVTVSPEGKAHILAVTPELADGELVVDAVGRHTLANVAVNPVATLVWPPTTEGGYSLIVDGTAAGAESAPRVTVAPTKAILHRPAPGPDGKRAGNDCLQVPVPSAFSARFPVNTDRHPG
jgi:hypothetical protein